MSKFTRELETGLLRMAGLEVRPYAYLANTKFAFLDLKSLRVSPELFERIKTCRGDEVEAQFQGITILDLRKYQVCRD